MHYYIKLHKTTLQFPNSSFNDGENLKLECIWVVYNESVVCVPQNLLKRT